MDTALDLFVKKGYSKTTVQEIIDAMNASKGAFYHYFSSKEEIIDNLIDEDIHRYKNILSDLSRQKDRNAVGKFREMVTRLQAMRHENREKQLKLFHLMESKENVLFYQQLMERVKAFALPYYVKIIEQGIDEGLFHVRYPEYTAELILQSITYFRRKMALIFFSAEDKSKVMGQIHDIILFIDELMHTLLGVAPGTLNIKEEYFKYLKS